MKRKTEAKMCKEPQWVKPMDIGREWVNFSRELQSRALREIVAQKHQSHWRWGTNFPSPLQNQEGVEQSYQLWQTTMTKAICFLWQNTCLSKLAMIWFPVMLPRLLWANNGLAHPHWLRGLLFPVCLSAQSRTELKRYTPFKLTSSRACLILQEKHWTPLNWKRSVLYLRAQLLREQSSPRHFLPTIFSWSLNLLTSSELYVIGPNSYFFFFLSRTFKAILACFHPLSNFPCFTVLEGQFSYFPLSEIVHHFHSGFSQPW